VHFTDLTPRLFAQRLPADLLARIFAVCVCELRLDGAAQPAPAAPAAVTPAPTRRRAAHRRSGKDHSGLQAAASTHGSDEGSADGQPPQRHSSTQLVVGCEPAAPEAVRTRASAPAVAHMSCHQGVPSSACASALAPASFAAAGERARAAAAAMAPPAWQPPPPRDCA